MGSREARLNTFSLSPVLSPGVMQIGSEQEDTEHHWREGWSSPSGGPEAIGAAVPVVNVGGNLEAAPIKSGANFSKIRKRSFKRALRRAQLHGETMYRGRRLVSSSPQLPVVEEPMVSKESQEFVFYPGTWEGCRTYFSRS